MGTIISGSNHNLYARTVSPGTIRAIGIALPLLLASCQKPSSNNITKDESPETSGEASRTKVVVQLPPSPSFQASDIPEHYEDGSWSVSGRKMHPAGDGDEALSVRGRVIEVYQQPRCPRGETCKAALAPHFWIADRTNMPREKGVIVVDYPQKKFKPVVGREYRIRGIFAKSSDSGFASNEGVLIYKKHDDLSKVLPH